MKRLRTEENKSKENIDLADIITSSPFFIKIKRSIIKETYLGGVIMAFIIIGSWNIVNALKTDPLISGLISLIIGIFLFIYQAKSLIVQKQKWSFTCICGNIIKGKGSPKLVKCPACKREYERNI